MKDEDKARHGNDRRRRFARQVADHLTAIGLVCLVATFVIPAVLLSFLPWAQAHRTIVVFGALNLFALSSIVLLTLHITARTQKGLLSYKAVVQSCGIEGFHPFKTAEERKAGWGACDGGFFRKNVLREMGFESGAPPAGSQWPGGVARTWRLGRSRAAAGKRP